jgi:hypothetical protein
VRGEFRQEVLDMTIRTLLAAVLGCAVAAPAWATDCNINVFNAYNTAKLRGWTFECSRQPSVAGGFVPYPPPLSSIGCTFKTPPVFTYDKVGLGWLFGKNSGQPPDLKDGWRVKSFEVSGGQWEEPESDSPNRARVAFRANATAPNRTYNYYISKLTLSKDGGSCSNAIDEAF